MLTSYVNPFYIIYPEDLDSIIYLDRGYTRVNHIVDFNAGYGYDKHRLYLSSAAAIEKNDEKLIKPFRALWYSAHFVFSHGHFVLNAGYDS